ncbi:hypothetical protein SAMN02799615_02344 [Dyella marensis]|uniref:Uncharacterized protein n=1 Tax=Dyella marensis TaxID=500610 RepID=A0A1I2FMC5_9GAMM|nr:hypothetical protein SAMN02799615_02344 [Dyella marensis]
MEVFDGEPTRPMAPIAFGERYASTAKHMVGIVCADCVKSTLFRTVDDVAPYGSGVPISVRRLLPIV